MQSLNSVEFLCMDIRSILSLAAALNTKLKTVEWNVVIALVAQVIADSSFFHPFK